MTARGGSHPRAAARRRWHLVLPGSLEATTGGTRYDRRVVAGLRSAGWDAEVHELPGDYPRPETADVAAARCTFARVPDGALVAVDGLALGALPAEARAHARRLRLVALVHHPLCDETGLAPAVRDALLASERASLAHVRAVVVTSASTARRLAELDLVPATTPVHVVEPGVDAAPPSPARRPGETCRLVSVGGLTTRKAHDDAANALSGLTELDWTWTVVGRTDQESACADALLTRVAADGLRSRVEITGELDDASLAAVLERSHVLVHPARYEGYGMAVAEALSRALPAVVSTGGALGDTAPEDASLRFEPGDVDGLRDRLERVVRDANVYASLRAGAERARSATRPWERVADAFRAVLEEVAE